MSKPLKQTVLENRLQERELAIASHNYGRKEFLDVEIKKLRKEIDPEREAKLANMTDREKVSAWLDWANVTDPSEREEVLTNCRNNPEDRAGFVRSYHEDCLNAA